MKKIILLCTVFASQLNLFGQAVPNGTFESWTTTPYNDPTGWSTGNKRDIDHFGAASLTKVTGFSGYALRVETNISGSDTSESYGINTANPCSDPPSWGGGVPYSQLPSALTGYYRYSLPGTDTAIMIVIFRKSGVHVGDNLIKVKGTGSQLTWASFSFPLTCSVVPDTMIFAVASSNKMSSGGSMDGSFIELDNLAFAGTTQVIPNGDFESWTAKSVDGANGWETWGEGMSRTSTSYLGSYAVRLETTSFCGDNSPSGITTGHQTSFSGPTGGRPYTGTVDTLCGYYKYAPSGLDTANVYINLSNSGSPVGGAWKALPAASSYTYFEIPFSSFSTPDTMRIDIQSSKWPVPPTAAGSVLYIDHIWLKAFPLGISEQNFLAVESYPNPVKDLLTVKFGKDLPGTMDLYVYDGTGRLVETAGFVRNLNSMVISTAGLPSGIYFYEIRTPQGTLRNKFIKE